MEPTIMRPPAGYIWETVAHEGRPRTSKLRRERLMLASPRLEVPEHEFDDDDWDDAEDLDSDELDVDLDEEELEPEDDEDF
jgi:hypothetical protein